MTVKEHYDNHLGPVYSWMTGDFRGKANEFKRFLSNNSITPVASKIAVDLGSGHGIQTIPLAELGFNVIAVDFNEHLLNELKSNAKGLNVTVLNDDLRRVRHFVENAELIVCGGDTLSHLESKQEISDLISDIAAALGTHGKVVLTFRDYSTPLTGTDRFISVKSDSDRILTCILDYENDFVNVTDLLYEKTSEGWKQKVSTYRKVRLATHEIEDLLASGGLVVTSTQLMNRLTAIIATKP